MCSSIPLGKRNERGGERTPWSGRMKKATLQLLVYLRSYLIGSSSHVQQSEAARQQIEIRSPFLVFPAKLAQSRLVWYRGKSWPEW